jgi:uncharacterized protein (DUF433 family)
VDLDAERRGNRSKGIVSRPGIEPGTPCLKGHRADKGRCEV